MIYTALKLTNDQYFTIGNNNVKVTHSNYLAKGNAYGRIRQKKANCRIAISYAR